MLKNAFLYNIEHFFIHQHMHEPHILKLHKSKIYLSAAKQYDMCNKLSNETVIFLTYFNPILFIKNTLLSNSVLHILHASTFLISSDRPFH